MSDVAETNGATADGRPPRPVALPVIAENIPAELKERNQWVVWKYEWNPRKKRKDGSGLKGEWDKPPSSVHTGRHADSTDPATWATFGQALAAYQGGGWDGIGFAPIPDNGLAVIDLDKCRDPATGVIEARAAGIVSAMETYTEVSPSSTGLRIVCRGRKPDRERSKKGTVEIYDGLTAEGKPGGKYLTFTGHALRFNGRGIENVPAAIADRQEQLSAVYERELKGRKPKPTPPPEANGHTQSAGNVFAKIRAVWTPPDGPLSDDDIIKLAESGPDEKLTRLWEGDTAGYGSQSEADAALCCKLLWWIGSADRDRLDGLFRKSKLMRGKWDEKRGEKTYGQMTLDYALGVQTDFRKPKTEDQTEADGEPPHEQAEADPEAPNFAHSVILAYFRERYRPVFRRGEAVYSEALRRDVKRTEAVATPDISVIVRLATTANAPKDKKGRVNWNGLPAFFSHWAKVAWGMLTKSLLDEEDADEVAAGAESEFRSRVAKGLLQPVTLGECIYRDGEQQTRTERRPMLHFCTQFARAGRWQSVRGYAIWCRMAPTPDGHGRLEVAVRAELFNQISFKPLSDIGPTMFTRLCENYGIGTADKATGRRAVLLTDDFLMSLLPDLNQADEGHAEEGNEG
jgi:hypothetical protein